MGNFHRRRLQHTTLNYRHGVSADQINWDKMEIRTLVILNPAWATVSLTTGMIWDGNCHSSSLDTDLVNNTCLGYKSAPEPGTCRWFVGDPCGKEHVVGRHLLWQEEGHLIRFQHLWKKRAPQTGFPLLLNHFPRHLPSTFYHRKLCEGSPAGETVTVLTMQQPHSRNFLPLKHFPFAEISFDNFVHTFPFPTLIIILFWIAFILSSCSSAECLHWSIHPVWTVNITLSQEIQRPINEPKKHYLFIRFETPYIHSLTHKNHHHLLRHLLMFWLVLTLALDQYNICVPTLIKPQQWFCNLKSVGKMERGHGGDNIIKFLHLALASRAAS